MPLALENNRGSASNGRIKTSRGSREVVFYPGGYFTKYTGHMSHIILENGPACQGLDFAVGKECFQDQKQLQHPQAKFYIYFIQRCTYLHSTKPLIGSH